jgi:hypothetical protein
MKSLTKPLKDIAVLTTSLTLAFILALAANFAYGQWSNPPAAAPGGNIQAPVNVGSSNQIKSGDITAWRQKAGAQMWSPQYCDQNGLNCFTSASVSATPPSSVPTPPVCTGSSALQWNGTNWSCSTEFLANGNSCAEKYVSARYGTIRPGDHLEIKRLGNSGKYNIYICLDGTWQRTGSIGQKMRSGGGR